jgi:hypothetical protein
MVDHTHIYMTLIGTCIGVWHAYMHAIAMHCILECKVSRPCQVYDGRHAWPLDAQRRDLIAAIMKHNHAFDPVEGVTAEGF